MVITMASCIFNGTFDPITLGHVDIVHRALRVFDKVYFVIMDNKTKNSTFSLDERVEMAKLVFCDIPEIQVMTYSGLTADLCEKLDAFSIVRGVRDGKDFDYEANLDMVNKKLQAKIDTVFLAARQELYHISSSAVRELMSYKGDFSPFVPKVVNDYLIKRLG